MAEKLHISPGTVQKHKNVFHSRLCSPGFNFFAGLRKRDFSQYKPVASVECANVLNAFEQMLGVYGALKETIRHKQLLLDSRGNPGEFIEIFSLYAGALSARCLLSRINPNTSELSSRFTIDFSNDAGILDVLVNGFYSATEHTTSPELLIRQSNSFFDYLAETACLQKEKTVFSVLEERIAEYHIEVDGIVLNGFNQRQKSDAIVLQQVKQEDYVGNSELVNKLTSGLVNLLDYDFKAGKNPHKEIGDFQQTFLVCGEPGCGKSMGIALVLSKARDSAAARNIPFEIRELRNFKSSFYAESANNLKKVFSDVRKAKCLYALVVEDFDTVFFSRDELHNRPEDKDVLGTMINELESATSGAMENFVLIATANHPIDTDSALVDRLRQGQIRVMGAQTTEEYAAIWKKKLEHGIENGYVLIDDWTHIGELSKQHNLSNRDVRNCAFELVQDGSVARPCNFDKLSYEQKLGYLLKQKKKVCEQDCLDVINKYANEKDLEAKLDFMHKVQMCYCQMKIEQEAASIAGI